MLDANHDMNYLKFQKKEKQEKEHFKSKYTIVSNNREGTESTKDNTFSSAYMLHGKTKRESLSSVAEEETSSRGNTITSKLEQINENKSDSNSLKSDSEEEKDSSNTHSLKITKSTSIPSSKNDDETLKDIKAYRNSLKKTESNPVEKVPRKRVKFPKLLVLISKYPIYREMGEFLRKIKSVCVDPTNIPIEIMVNNLIYEFPHPGIKYIVNSEFWRTKEKSKFEFETISSLPYCEPKYFLELAKFQEKILVIWQLIERILFGKPIIMKSRSVSKLIAWSEILKNLIFPFQYPGLIVPYMCRPDMMLLASDQQNSYIVGLTPDTYKYVRNYLSSMVT